MILICTFSTFAFVKVLSNELKNKAKQNKTKQNKTKQNKTKSPTILKSQPEKGFLHFSYNISWGISGSCVFVQV